VYNDGKSQKKVVDVMDVIPFENTWPYERMSGDIYFDECPFCGERHVLTSMSLEALELAKEGVKVSINLPCCRGRLTVLEADDDYLWTNQALRK
jgi:hypothetical protein